MNGQSLISSSADIRKIRYKLIDLALDLQSDVLSERVNIWCRSLQDGEHHLSEALLQQAELLQHELEATRFYGESRPSAILVLKDVAKTYVSGGFSLSGVNLTLQSGQITGIVGENGNGKTTLLNLVAGNLEPDTGTLEYPFLGKRHHRYTLRENIGFIPQRIPKWHGKLRESMSFAASCYGIFGKSNEIRVEQIMHRLDLWKYNALSWNQISSGYKTRFEIARVLLARPKLLVLDEPLSNLDINTQQVLLNDLRQIAKSERFPMAVLMSSQQLHEIEKASDNILFLKNGQCLFQSEHDHRQLTGTVVETDFSGNTEVLLQRLSERGFTVRHIGGYIQISHTENDQGQLLLEMIAGSGAGLTYFRDISSSAKRFFNQ